MQPPGMETDIARAIVAIRLARALEPPHRIVPRRTIAPKGWTRGELARIAAAILYALAVAATIILAGVDAGAWLMGIMAVTSKLMGEILRTLAFAALGFVAGAAKALQAYADGQAQSLRVATANIIISTIFAVVGGVGADGYGLEPKLALCVAFAFGVMTFGSVRIIEDRLRK